LNASREFWHAPTGVKQEFDLLTSNEVFPDRLTTPFLQNTCCSAIEHIVRKINLEKLSQPRVSGYAVSCKFESNLVQLRVAGCWAATTGLFG
jgi:hypothetical protein